MTTSTLPVTRWWWIRHAPVRDDGGCIYGQKDLECDCDDTRIFDALAQVLPTNAVWVTSHLSRTKDTAKAIFAAGALPPPSMDEERAFAEQDFGEWQGLPRKDFFTARGVTPHSFWYCPADECPPGGETFEAVVARVRPRIVALTEAHAGQDIVAVAHGGTIRAALAVAMDVEPEASLAFSTDNCSITRLDHVGGGHPRYRWRIVCVNHRPWLGQKAPTRTGAIA